VSHHCERCGNALHPGYLTPEEFKARFKVGDVILGWSTRKRCQITAIGEERFLYRDPSPDFGRYAERVAKIRQSFVWEPASTLGKVGA